MGLRERIHTTKSIRKRRKLFSLLVPCSGQYKRFRKRVLTRGLKKSFDFNCSLRLMGIITYLKCVTEIYGLSDLIELAAGPGFQGNTAARRLWNP